MSQAPAEDLAGRVARLRAATAASPGDPAAWRRLGDALFAAGSAEEADQAYAASIREAVNDIELMQAAEALANGRLAVAEPILRGRLKRAPTDVAAIRMLAEVAGRLGRNVDAEKLLRRALELCPSFAAARANLALALHRQSRSAEAIAELDRLLDEDPDNPAHRNVKAAALGRIGGFEEAVELYEQVLARAPGQPKIWMSYGHVMKTVGKQGDAIAAYRRAIALMPRLGEAWWSLANLKTVRFDDADTAAMGQALTATDLSAEDRLHLHFALGKAFEDAGAFEPSFTHYAEGNRIRRGMIDYDADDIERFVDRSIALFPREAFRGEGCPDPDPIFVLGMPRAGSTLIEQILASHSMIEGTQELPYITAAANQLSGGRPYNQNGPYPACLLDMDAARLRELGKSYLDSARVHRRTDRPLFIDKLPNNWLHLPMILSILPNAKIIDARRHPLDCCFSNFKQHFARGQSFSYALDELGRYYADYVRLMAHFDAVLPGRVHRVIHERLVEDTEAEVRAMLDYLGVPFEPQCLRFWENERAVQTASSEQVRRPINREGMDRWREYERWLAPLKEALGPVLETYPAAPW